MEKDIKVVNGDGENLDISPVYNHLNSAKPKTDKKDKKNIIIPKGKN